MIKILRLGKVIMSSLFYKKEMFIIENQKIKRGEIYYANLSGARGSEERGIRPVLIIQNDTGNENSPTTIIAPITAKIIRSKLPTHIFLKKCEYLKFNSLILLEQIRTIDKDRLGTYVGSLSNNEMKKVDYSIRISLSV